MTQEKIKCKNCSSKNIIKKGLKKNKLQTLQRYLCKDCGHIFTEQQIKHKTYPIEIILRAISAYNLGYNLQETSEKIHKRYKIKIPLSTISTWLDEYKFLPYFKIRDKCKELFKPNNIIFKKTLHHIQPYTFKYHKGKLEILFKDRKYNNQFTNISQFYEQLKKYLQKIPTDKFPHHIFKDHKNDQSCPTAEIAKNKDDISTDENNEQRASQLKFSHLEIKRIQKNNLACKLASLALNLAITNKQRHEAIQNFMLINDSTTIATEIPIYLTNWDMGYYKCSKIKDFWHRARRNQRGFIFQLSNYRTPIIGHMDILQIRNRLIHILDYKPEAKNQNPIEQLTIYALALSRKLNLPLYYFKSAWFDENDYYEFYPLHAVYKTRRR